MRRRIGDEYRARRNPAKKGRALVTVRTAHADRAPFASTPDPARPISRGDHRVLVALALAASLGCSRSSPPAGSADPGARSEPNARLADAADVLATVAGEGDDHHIPTAVAARVRCVAVVPSLINGAFFVGAKYGHGVLTCRTGEGAGSGWSSPAFFTLKGGSAGFEIGVQSVDLVMLVLSEHGRRAFMNEELRLGGDVSATAGPEGRGRSEDTDASLRSEVVSYSRSRGLFAGVDLSGAVVRADPDAARAFYGQNEAVATLLESPAPTPSPADAFLSRVRASF
jgi:SH3 domain-containing YSC84-like protein 1